MVRRVIATKIGEMAQVYEKENIVSDLIPSFKQLSADDQDLVRVLCLDSLKSLAKVLSRDDNKTHTLPVIIQAAEDKSWRVRLSLSKNFSDIAESFGKEITDLSLVQTFSALLKDVENDVKIEAVKSLSRFVKIISADKLTILIPLIMTLGKDPYSSVRCK
jgi:serine/threonine-protein phosphatase 2A regulatory subunit A